METCRLCGKELTQDETGAYRKLINRGAKAEDFLCREHLADWLGVTPETIDRKVEQFRRAGCTLFTR